METFKFKNIDSSEYSIYIADGETGTSTYTRSDVEINTVSVMYGNEYSVGKKEKIQNYQIEVVLIDGNDEKYKKAFAWLQGEGYLSLDREKKLEEKVIVKNVSTGRRLTAKDGFHYTFQIEFQPKNSRGKRRVGEVVYELNSKGFPFSVGDGIIPDLIAKKNTSEVEVDRPDTLDLHVPYKGSRKSYFIIKTDSLNFKLSAVDEKNVEQLIMDYVKIEETETTETEGSGTETNIAETTGTETTETETTEIETIEPAIAKIAINGHTGTVELLTEDGNYFSSGNDIVATVDNYKMLALENKELKYNSDKEEDKAASAYRKLLVYKANSKGKIKIEQYWDGGSEVLQDDDDEADDTGEWSVCSLQTFRIRFSTQPKVFSFQYYVYEN